jgi:predicted class III extradiol MEMO1 family dioxygenase
VRALDEALLLEGSRLEAAVAQARLTFRAQPFRPPVLAARSYPAPPEELETYLASFASAPVHTSRDIVPLGPLGGRRGAAGVLSPHIDFARGGPVYAATWSQTTAALATCDVVVVFGTDHWGAPGALTLTTQHYATPWGVLPADRSVVDAVAHALGAGAYAQELHHQREHAVELAVVWLHWALRRCGRSALPAVIPVLCGSFHAYTSPPLPGRAPADAGPAGECPLPEEAAERAAALEALAVHLSQRRVLVVSAADLAHVGPAFGDQAPLSPEEKRRLAAADQRLLGAIQAGDAGDFLALLRQSRDRTRVCGLPPTYWAMRLLERLNGQAPAGRVTAYAQCPADEQFGSVVSIAGALWE